MMTHVTCDEVPGLDWLQSGVEDTLGSGVGGFLPLARGPISDIGAWLYNTNIEVQ